MKRLLTIAFFLLIGQRAFATDWFAYFIYVQKEYIQGSWLRSNLLDNSGSYLEPRQFEELFSISGGGRDMANAILAHLKEETPERYKFKLTLSISNDTIIIQAKDNIPDFDAVKNELTASFILNNYSAVRIIQQSRTGIYTLKDLSVPYMDLILPAHKTTQSASTSYPGTARNDTATVPQKTQPGPTEQSKNMFSIWLIISLAINFLLIIYLISSRK